jgi:hypothetical protein
MAKEILKFAAAVILAQLIVSQAKKYIPGAAALLS